MKKYGYRRPLIKYRFKDRMGCVFFKAFHTGKEARLWFERNKVTFMLVEIGCMDQEGW